LFDYDIQAIIKKIKKMKNLFYLSAISLLAIFSSCGGKTAQTETGKETTLNVMTFNIRLDAASDSLNNWKYRKDVAAELIKTNNADIVGTQEVLLNQLNDLKERLPEYNAVGVGREDGKEEGEFCALFYKKDKFEEVKSGNFWLSETPDVPGSRGWDAACKRVATWAVLKDKATGKELIAINTHLDHIGVVARKEGGDLMLRRAGELGKDLPLILTGDFNVTPESETVKNITDTTKEFYLIDSKSIAAKTEGTDWTFHDFGRLPEGERERIDFIFVSKDITVTDYKELPEKLNDIFTSDHKSVIANISI